MSTTPSSSNLSFMLERGELEALFAVVDADGSTQVGDQLRAGRSADPRFPSDSKERVEKGAATGNVMQYCGRNLIVGRVTIRSRRPSWFARQRTVHRTV